MLTSTVKCGRFGNSFLRKHVAAWAARHHCCDRPKCCVMQFVQWLSVDGILIYFRNLCMGLHFHGFIWPVRKDFGKKPLVCCKWEESSKSAFLSCRHYVGFQLKLMTKPFVITHRIFPRVRQGLPFWTGKSFLQAGVRNGCRRGAVNFCSNI